MSTNYHSTKTIPTIPKTLNRTISPIITGHRKQGLTYLLGGQGRHMWLTGWWYVSLMLQDIAMRNLHDINRGRYLILLPWRFPGSQVFMLATYIANCVASEPISNIFPHRHYKGITNQQQHSTNKNRLQHPHTFTPIASTRQKTPSTFSSPESPLLLCQGYIHTIHKDGSENLAMTAQLKRPYSKP